jgi:hypothetical protein
MTMSDAEYVGKKGIACPACGQSDQPLEGGPVEVDEGVAWQEVTCPVCGASWGDQYRLFGYDGLTDGPEIHPLFHTLRADEVAECLEGIPSGSDLYCRLWDIVGVMPGITEGLANIDDLCPGDVRSEELALSTYWHLLSQEHRDELNRLAALRESGME